MGITKKDITKYGNIKEQIILDIDSHMVLADMILSKYIEMPNAIYIRGLRFPLTSRRDLTTYQKYGISGNEPWHPIIVAPLLKDMLEYYQYTHTQYANLFHTSTLGDPIKIYNVPVSVTDEQLILNYVPSISESDIDELIEIFVNVYHMLLESVFEENPDSIYTIDINTSRYILLRHDDIRAYRYTELCDAGLP
jgi:hypothetical protein